MRKLLTIFALLAFFTGTVCAGLLSAVAGSSSAAPHHSVSGGMSGNMHHQEPLKSRGDPDQRCMEQCETLFLSSIKAKEEKRQQSHEAVSLFAAACIIHTCLAHLVDSVRTTAHPEFRTTIAPLNGAVYAMTKRLRI